MKCRRLGRTGLKVSTLCLGTMTFGNSEWGSNELEACRTVNAFLDAEGNFIDTADVYSHGVADVTAVLVSTAEAIGKSPSQVALAWCVGQPGITSAVMGARTVSQLGQNLAAADITLDEPTRNAVDKASGLEPIYPYDMQQTLRALLQRSTRLMATPGAAF